MAGKPKKQFPKPQLGERQKFIKAASDPKPTRIPRTEYYEEWKRMNPVWRIGFMQQVGPWGWHHIDALGLQAVLERLAQHEKKTWSEILVIENRWNHEVEKSGTCAEAQKRLTELELEDLDFLVSFRLNQLQRIWGFRVHNVLHLLWWDPEHKVWPTSEKR